MNDWIDIKIIVALNDAERAEDIANEISSEGIYIEDYSALEREVAEIAHVDLIEADLLAKARDEVTIHIYAAGAKKGADVAAHMRSCLLSEGIEHKIAGSGIVEEDWANSWRQYYHARDIASRLAIVPSWETYDTQRTVIRLDPGLAFGTGTHETTMLCLEQLDAIVKGGERVLDVGTGSGILGIAALLLGAKAVDAIDIDPVCVRTAAENAELNACAERFNAMQGDLSARAKGKYDIICANIVADAIISIVPTIKPLLAQDGVFIASGIIQERKAEVEKAYSEANLHIEKILTDGIWVMIAAK